MLFLEWCLLNWDLLCTYEPTRLFILTWLDLLSRLLTHKSAKLISDSYWSILLERCIEEWWLLFLFSADFDGLFRLPKRRALPLSGICWTPKLFGLFSFSDDLLTFAEMNCCNRVLAILRLLLPITGLNEHPLNWLTSLSIFSFYFFSLVA